MVITFGGLESLLLRVEVFEGKLQENGLKMCKTNGSGWYADSLEEILLEKNAANTCGKDCVPWIFCTILRRPMGKSARCRQLSK